VTPVFHYSSGLARVICAGPGAFTIGRHVFCSEASISERVKRHELCHVEQASEYGLALFTLLYWWYQLRHGYRLNPFEVEARRAELRP
jgi:hypothetical protein